MDNQEESTKSTDIGQEPNLGGDHMSSVGKSDLRKTKTELFNKLIGNQAQQLIVTPPNKKDGQTNTDLVANISGANIKSEPNTDGSQKRATNSSCAKQQLEDSSRLEPVVFSGTRTRWYTNEEVASILTSFSSHPEWQTNELQLRPKSGAVLLYSREKVRYRQDGYCWKKRKNGRTTREDHMKLKVQGIECIYGCYVHSAILPTFHRRCYWLLQNPDIVLVHYLNQPPDDQNKMMLTFNSSLLEADTRRSWTNEEIIEEIGSVFGGISQIHHTLSINFPPSATIIHSQPEHDENNIEDRMIESSPQSQTNSEQLSEQVSMTISEQQQPQQMICSNELVNQSQDNDHNNNNSNDQNRELDEDEIMTISQESNQAVSANDLNNINCDDQIEGRKLQLQQQHLQDNSITSMTLDIVNECRRESLNNMGQQSVDCYNFSSLNANNNLSLNNVNVVTSDNDNNNMMNGVPSAASLEPSSSAIVNMNEQSPCSPVTQIYNKIVDDIETYALPLEPNHFSSSHHAISISSGVPIQSMDLGGSTSAEQHHHHHDNIQGSSGQQSQQDHHHHHHHQQQQAQHGQHQPNVNQQFTSADACGTSHDVGDLNKDQSDCSMDLTSCDLFGNAINEIEQTDVVRETNNDPEDGSNGLILSDFNLPTENVGTQVTDDLGASVVDTLANVDDLRDLMMGISSTGNEVNADPSTSNLLVDTNSLDLFNFKPSSSDNKQHLDVKSSTSDTDTMNRLSPMAPLVPRCNSTDNAMQSSSQRLDQYQHHMSSHFLTSSGTTQAQVTMMHGTFSEYDHNLNPHRSATSTNANNSTSCSPSPSSSSLLTTGHPSSTRSAYIDGSSHCSTGSSSHSFIKLPLPQRQKSEQKEPSNSVLSSLLPKALSLDGSDLSVTGHRGSSASPLVGPYSRERHQNQQNLLLMPPGTATASTTTQTVNNDQDQLQTMATPHQQYYQESTGISPLSPVSVPQDNFSNSSQKSMNPESVLASSVYRQQQQQPSTTLEYPKLQHATVSNIRLLPILDYVPNWSTVSGGAKVLIIGEWISLLNNIEKRQQQQQTSSMAEQESVSDSSGFFAIFDDLLVTATLIQDNVLRCYAPSHDPGFITLKVLYKNCIVSEQVLFEIRPACIQSIDQMPSSFVSSTKRHSDDNHHDLLANHHNGGSGSMSVHHRDSTSSNQSSNSSNFAPNQNSQVSPTTTGNSISCENNHNNNNNSSSKMLSLADYIMGELHRKSNSYRTVDHNRSRMANSLDIESQSDHNYYQHPPPQQQQQQQQQQQPHHEQKFHRQHSLKAPQRRICDSRSLSRDSEPTNTYYGVNNGMGASNGNANLEAQM